MPDAPTSIPDHLDFTDAGPLPPHWINNAYDGWNTEAQIVWPECGLCLKLTADGPFDCFVIYSPDSEADFFCFEPMTHLPNAHNMPAGGGLVTLAPGQSLTCRLALYPAVLPV